jgi:hypothetical protein
MLLDAPLGRSREERTLAADTSLTNSPSRQFMRIQTADRRLTCGYDERTQTCDTKHFDTTIYFFVQVCNHRLVPMATDLEYRKDVYT